MTTLDPGMELPLFVQGRGTFRVRVEEYHRLRDIGLLDGETRFELLDGYITPKMTPKPPHASTTEKLRRRFEHLKGDFFAVRQENPVTLDESEPVPDLCVVRQAGEDDYDERHPGAADCEIVVEVSDTTLRSDRTEMLAIYSRNKVPVYWIVNLADRCVEVHQVPNGTEAKPKYKTRKVFKEGQSVPVVLGGLKVGAVAVSDITPRPRKSSPSARR